MSEPIVRRWEEMAPRERDALVAEKGMGWERRDNIIPYGYNQGRIISACPHFTTDHTTVALIREEVGRRGLEREFIFSLLSLLEYPDESHAHGLGYRLWALEDVHIWHILNATPDQQCHAFVRACGMDV